MKIGRKIIPALLTAATLVTARPAVVHAQEDDSVMSTVIPAATIGLNAVVAKQASSAPQSSSAALPILSEEDKRFRHRVDAGIGSVWAIINSAMLLGAVIGAIGAVKEARREREEDHRYALRELSRRGRHLKLVR